MKTKQKANKKTPAAIYYLNFKNIQADVQRCGFEITPVRLLTYYLLTLAGCVAVCIPFRLPVVSMVAVSVAGIVCMPVVLVSSCRQKYEEARFVETSIYISQMLSAFSIKPKILEALKSTKGIATSVPMSETVNAAIEHILYTSYSAGDIREEALAVIEAKYNCKRIKTLHKFLINVENKGGEYNQTIDLLQKDRELWENRVEEFRKDESSKKTEAVLSAGFVIIVCWFVMFLGKFAKLDITPSPVYQVSTTAMIIAEMLLYIKINCSLSMDLLQKVSFRPEKSILKDYQTVVGYDEKRENMRSLKRSILPAVILLAGILLNKFLLIIMGGAALFFTIFDKRVGYSMTVKQLRKEIAFAYPQWLMEMALLLHGNNVRNSIRMTVENSHPVLRKALEKLVAELDESPNSMEPYLDFLGPLRTKEINTSMSMLYAASSGTNGNTDERIKEIINSTIKMTDKAEKLENADKLLGLDLMFKAPVIPGTVNIFIYAAIVMMSAMDMGVYIR